MANATDVVTKVIKTQSIQPKKLTKQDFRDGFKEYLSEIELMDGSQAKKALHRIGEAICMHEKATVEDFVKAMGV